MPAPKKPAGTQQGHRSLQLMTGAGVARLEIPAPPAGLEKASVALWNAYWESPPAAVALDVDKLGVAGRWIEAVDERRKALRGLRKARLVKGSTGQPTLNPLAAWIKSREDVIAKCEAELGLTPYARQRLGIAVGQAALTAAELNRMTEEIADGGEDDVIDAEILDEFEEA